MVPPKKLRRRGPFRSSDGAFAFWPVAKCPDTPNVPRVPSFSGTLPSFHSKSTGTTSPLSPRLPFRKLPSPQRPPRHNSTGTHVPFRWSLLVRAPPRSSASAGSALSHRLVSREPPQFIQNPATSASGPHRWCLAPRLEPGIARQLTIHTSTRRRKRDRWERDLSPFVVGPTYIRKLLPAMGTDNRAFPPLLPRSFPHPPRSHAIVAPQPPRSGGASSDRSTRGSLARKF